MACGVLQCIIPIGGKRGVWPLSMNTAGSPGVEAVLLRAALREELDDPVAKGLPADAVSLLVSFADASIADDPAGVKAVGLSCRKPEGFTSGVVGDVSCLNPDGLTSGAVLSPGDPQHG